ncbi:hypothetical protein HK105_206213 [Polyrhizophydium stewartii]|uniref:AB hydrolase-1 domain-containing protein n=1 Tax=Polyrhizophydium stewartii TaxID=2732419 RepID=A0ABR4N405_9FUNG
MHSAGDTGSAGSAGGAAAAAAAAAAALAAVGAGAAGDSASFRRKTLVLFVHGFQGSETSFGGFPVDVVRALRPGGRGPRDVEARVLPRFATAGSAERAAARLHNWLLLNAAPPEYDAVVVLAHSMGGLVAVDAWRALLARAAAAAPPPAAAAAAAAAAAPDAPLLALDAPGPARASLPINIAAIICFDSPFFGLNKVRFAAAATAKAAEVVADYLPESARSAVSAVPSAVGSGLRAGSELASSAYAAIPTPSQAVASIPAAIRSGSAMASSAMASLPSASDAVRATAGVALSLPGVIAEAPRTIARALPSLATLASLIPMRSTASTPQATAAASDASTPTVTTNAPPADPTSTEPSADAALTSSDAFKLVAEPEGIAEPQGVANRESVAEPESVTPHVQQPPSAPAAEPAELERPAEPVKPAVPADRSPRAAGLPDPATEHSGLIPIPPDDTNWSPWFTFGVGAAAVAAGAYYSGGLLALGSVTLARRIAVAYALSHAEEARKQIQFLYPIWGESAAETEARMDLVLDRVRNHEFFFRCFYVQVPKPIAPSKPLPAATPAQKDAAEAPSVEAEAQTADEPQPATRDQDPEMRTFIAVPPKKAAALFHPVGTDCSDEITAHMSMFARDTNPGHYWVLVSDVAELIRRIINHVRSPTSDDAQAL